MQEKEKFYRYILTKKIFFLLKIFFLFLLSINIVQAADLSAQSGETVFFRGWQYRTDIVQSNIDRYNNEMNGNVDQQTVTGDYPAIMEQNLMSGGDLDIFYANPSQASRYYDGGWVKPANELPNFEEIKADMYPAMLDAWSYKGDLLGLAYFVATRGTMHVNLLKLEEIGMSEDELPANWDELYDMAKAINDNTSLPIIIYNIPSRCVIDMSVDTMARLFELKNIAGVKDATGDLNRIEKTIKKLGPEYIKIT